VVRKTVLFYPPQEERETTKDKKESSKPSLSLQRNDRTFVCNAFTAEAQMHPEPPRLVCGILGWGGFVASGTIFGVKTLPWYFSGVSINRWRRCRGLGESPLEET
jgi:hypothetical protein